MLTKSGAYSGIGNVVLTMVAAGVLATNIRTGREIPITSKRDLSLEQLRAEAIFSTLSKENYSRAQTSIRFALANKDISCVLAGIANLAQLDEAIEGVLAGPLPERALVDLETVYDLNFGLN